MACTNSAASRVCIRAPPTATFWPSSVATSKGPKIENRTDDEQSRFEQLEQALRDLPDWSVVPERDVRRDTLLADIKAALEKRR